MQGYYEIETAIPASHQINLQLPDTIPAGKVKITIIYEATETSTNQTGLMIDFLNSLPDSPQDGLTREEIRHIGIEERRAWDE